jgi:hypothetical protein
VRATHHKTRRLMEVILPALLALLIATAGITWLRTRAGAQEGEQAHAATKDQAPGVPVAVVKVRRGDLADTLALAAEFRPFRR